MHIERESKYTAVLPESSVEACCFFLKAEGFAMHARVCVCVCVFECEWNAMVLAGFHVYYKLSPCLFECASLCCSCSWLVVCGGEEQGQSFMVTGA